MSAATTLWYRCPSCGVPTELDLIVEGEPRDGELREFAVTCDCGRSAWFELRAAQPSAEEEGDDG